MVLRLLNLHDAAVELLLRHDGLGFHLAFIYIDGVEREVQVAGYPGIVFDAQPHQGKDAHFGRQYAVASQADVLLCWEELVVFVQKVGEQLQESLLNLTRSTLRDL